MRLGRFPLKINLPLSLRYRDPTWHDFYAQFKVDRNPSDAINERTSTWCRIYSLDNVIPQNGIFTIELWSIQDIWRTVQSMMEASETAGSFIDLITEKRPRRQTRPLCAIATQGQVFLIDGRRRVNFWLKAPPRSYAVLKCTVEPTGYGSES